MKRVLKYLAYFVCLVLIVVAVAVAYRVLRLGTSGLP